MLIEHMQMTQSYQFQINQKKHWKETETLTPTSPKLNVTVKKKQSFFKQKLNRPISIQYRNKNNVNSPN